MSFQAYKRKVANRRRQLQQQQQQARVEPPIRRGKMRHRISQAIREGRLEDNRKPARATKLNETVRLGICKEIAAGNTMEVSAGLNGVHHVTLWTWIRAGQAEPDGPYGEFAREIAWAQDIAHKKMVGKLINHEDWRATSFIMKNRWPKLYRDHIVQEMQGPDGGPIPMSMQTFSVILELHPPQEKDNGQQPPEPAFRVEGIQPAAAMPDLAQPFGQDR